jgi:hypothetical protein
MEKVKRTPGGGEGGPFEARTKIHIVSVVQDGRWRRRGTMRRRERKQTAFSLNRVNKLHPQ